MDEDTIADYIDALNRMFVLTDQPPFSSNVRSSVRIKQSSKHHFADPSIAASLLGVTASSLIEDLKTFGFLFEPLCEHDLKIYAESFGGKLYHYQDYKNREIDAVVEYPDRQLKLFKQQIPNLSTISQFNSKIRRKEQRSGERRTLHENI